MRLIPLFALTLLLSACATTEPTVLVKHQYIVRQASEAQKALPAMPAAIDVKTADQSTLAQWIVDTEKRMMELEAIIKRLIEFYERPVTEDEKKAAK